MPARLIINADDFGLTPGVNRSVEELHRAGALSSATLMANGPAFEDAVAIALRNPSLGVGCHVVFTDGVPLSLPQSIPSLLGPDGTSFRPSLLAFAAAATCGKLRPDDVRTEAIAQIRKLQGAGIAVTHIDTHKHAHLFPAVIRPLLEAARQTSVHAVRNPFEPPWSLALAQGSPLRRLELNLLRPLEHRLHTELRRDRTVATTKGTLGISTTGRLDAPALRQLLQRLPPGTWELVCHPGYNDPDLDRLRTRLRTHREIERNALLTVVPEILAQPGAPVLIHYGSLAARDDILPGADYR